MGPIQRILAGGSLSWSASLEGVTVPARVAVIGGGISGLAAAYCLRQALGETAEIVVFDKQPQIGGQLRVSDVAGLPVDEGAESLLARRPEAVDLARAVVGADDIVHPAPVGAALYSRGQLWPLPAGAVMGVPATRAGVVGPLTESEAQAMDADSDAHPSLPMPISGDVAIGRLVAARYGQAVVDRLVEPLLGGVYAGHAAELSLDATVPALGAAAREHSSLAAAVHAAAGGGRRASSSSSARQSPVFAGVIGGVGRLPALVANAARASIRTGVTVRELTRTKTGWQLVTGPAPHPSLYEADAVVVATPAAATAKLLRTTVPLAAAELAAVESASMAVVALAMPRSAFAVSPSTSGFLVPPVEGRLVKAVTYSSVKWPWLGEQAGDTVLLRASVGRHRQEADLQRDDAELVRLVLSELAESAGLSGAPIDTRVTRWGGALPQYAVGHVERAGRVRAAISAAPGLAVCGSAYDGVGVAACVGTARSAATRVVDHLAARRARIEA